MIARLRHIAFKNRRHLIFKMTGLVGGAGSADACIGRSEDELWGEPGVSGERA